MGSKKVEVDPNVGLAQREQAAIAKAAQERAAASDDFFQKNFAPRYLAQMDESIALSRDESARQQQMADYSLGLSKKYDQRYWDTTAKQQDAFYKIVDEYDSAGMQEREASRATADVEQGAAASRATLIRNMQRMGINPGSAAGVAAMADSEMNVGLARAGAANMAREAARREGLNLRSMAAGLGGNLTGASSGFLGQSSGMGMSSIGALGSGMGAIGGAQGGFGANTQSVNSSSSLAANTWGNVGNLGMQVSQFNQKANSGGSAIGKIAGGLIGAYLGGPAGASAGASIGGSLSDRRLKTDIKRIGTMANGLPVYQYRFKHGGPMQIGVMADEVAILAPHAHIPGGGGGGYDAVDYSKLG